MKSSLVISETLFINEKCVFEFDNIFFLMRHATGLLFFFENFISCSNFLKSSALLSTQSIATSLKTLIFSNTSN